MGLIATAGDRHHAAPRGGARRRPCIARLAGSDVTEAVLHSENDYPIIIAGRAGGRVREGVGHYRSPNAESLSNVGLACLKAVVPQPDSITEYGSDDGNYTGYTTEPTGTILA